ncbi:MAG: hypothetical protein DCC55_39505 [Chloroflexi bacterium]|jgi:hypothetical protein|nr:MAG: hypothetical protein DCC55_39505 [Chloroflexota bacterium]
MYHRFSQPQSAWEGVMMLLSYASLRRDSKAFAHLTGLSVAEFEALYARFEPAWVEAEQTRLHQRVRQRAVGGGGDYRLTLETRLLMVLVWLRHYLTTEALGYLFGVSQSTASRTLSRLLPVLAGVAEEGLHRPPSPPGGMRRSWRQWQQAEPDLFAILDATEQSVNRPQDETQARLYFSGKQRRTTCKTTLHVNEAGLIRQVAASRPGSVADITHLRHSGLLAHIPQATIAVADTAFLGLGHDLPCHSVLCPHRASRDHPLLPDQRLANREVARVRIKVENVLAHLKRFRILSHRFRHPVATVHTQVFILIAALHNWRTAARLAAAEAAP